MSKELSIAAHKSLRFRLLDRSNLKEIEALDQYAATFGHRITTLRHPIMVVSERETERILGYFQIVSTPIVFPALNPDAVTPRQTAEIMQHFVGWAKVQHGEGFVAVPTNKPNNKFTPEVMAKLGFDRQNAEIYRVKGDD